MTAGDDTDIGGTDISGTSAEGDAERRLRDAIAASAPPREPTNAQAALARMWVQMEEDPRESFRGDVPGSRRAPTLRPGSDQRGAPGSMHQVRQVRRVMLAVGVAAMVVVATIVAREHAAPRGTQSVRELATAAAGRATVTLRDGTRLVLAPDSRLRVPADFGVRERLVELDGEAELTVVHDAAHPFAVRTARAVVRDIGTRFVMQAYATDPLERVAVADGAVVLAPNRSTTFGNAGDTRPGTTLGPGSVATVDGVGRVTLRTGVDVTPYLAWTQGRLVFQNTPLADVARQLSRTFDLSITVADSVLATDEVTGAYGNESPDDILDDITRAAGARYERAGRVVVIRRRTAATIQPDDGLRRPLTVVQAKPDSRK